MINHLRIALCLLLAGGANASAQEAPLRGFDAGESFNLVRGLTEISGLAAASDHSVYAHNDEHGIVYELSLSNGGVIAAFALGDPTIRADFEGIAAVGDRIYLITSTGFLYEAMIGAHRSRVRFNVFDTGAGAICEVEGITPGPVDGEFILICKTPHEPKFEERLIALKWSLGDRAPVTEPWLDVSLPKFLSTLQERQSFRPSAVEWLGDQNALLILSARNHLLTGVTLDGDLLFKKNLDPAAHHQAEGLAIMSSGDLVIADEGGMRLPGVLSIYKAAQN